MSVGADSIIAASAIAIAAAGTFRHFSVVVTLSLMVGVVLLLAKTLHLGWVADMLSILVSTGFQAGIAVHIIASQVPVIINVVPTSEHFIFQIVEMFKQT